jgi:hypothetical protein
MTELPGQLAIRFPGPTLPGPVRLPGQLPGQLTLFDDDTEGDE